ncbi:TPA: hypothetical protein N0F65_004773 [Lagenidium giganteum]|uniref:Uncharacterized protein n=1 Tax=Lagenidium giganteum TaxID=4803 RepID=A0AAV2YVA3_9STRA|nr:TPA: hypothetical protein N0F65_004773 [Lagenidium giganteum]
MADELAAIVGNDERIPWRYSKDWNRIIELIKKDPAKLVPLLLELSLDWRSACLCQVAMRCGHDEGLVAVVEIMLQLGADPASKTEDGETPLYAAVCGNSLKACELILRRGVNPNVQVVENDDETTRLFLISQMCTWDANLFRDFCRKGRAKALAQYLDNFRIIPDPPREPCQVAVYFHDLHQFYGPPWLALTDTPLNDVLTSTEDVRALVAHPVFDRVLTLKWGGRVGLRLESLMPLVYVYVAIRFLIGLFLSTLSKRLTKRLLWFSSSFGRSMFLSESLLFLIMLVSTYTSFVSSDGSPGSKTSMVTSVMLLLLEALDIARRQWSYFRYVTNWINLSAYVGVLVLGCFFSEQPSSDDVQMARAIVIVLLCFCGLDYLQMISLTGLLIAITFKMLNDVIKFVVLYGVFQFGFSAAFLLLFHDQGSRYDSYGNSFMATFLMLVGDFDSDLFLRLDGTKAIVGNTLVVVYLVGAMVMLLNLLIAMMSTTYQQVLDSAKTARSIARAETIMRMENDCELFELVEGDESAGKISDLRQTQEDLKAHTAELIEKLKGDLKLEFEQQLAKQHELTIKHLEKKIESALQKLISSVDCTLDADTTIMLNLYLAVILFAVVVITCTFAFVRQMSTDKIMDSFQNMLPPLSSVIRDGKTMAVSATELVEGDLVWIKSGEKVPADLRLLLCSDLKVVCSSLTGQSKPMSCTAEAQERNVRALECTNVVFNGSVCRDGSALGLVLAVGDSTVIGKIAALASRTKPRETALETEFRALVRFITVIAVVMSTIFFIIDVIRSNGHDVLDLFVNGYLVIFVANVPQGLPATVTCILAITARKLSARDVLVKRLECIETLGSVTLIATDKTGTLTKNTMTVTDVWYGKEFVRHQSDVISCDIEPMIDFVHSHSLQAALYRCCSICNSAYPLDTAAPVPLIPSDPQQIPRPVVARRSNAWKQKREILHRKYAGNASDVALLRFCDTQFPIEAMRAKFPIIFEIPFNSLNKWQLVIVNAIEAEKSDEKQSVFDIYLKGAPEVVIKKCRTHLTSTGKEEWIGEDFLKEFVAAYETFGGNGRRVLAVATTRFTKTSPEPFDQENPTYRMDNLCFVALVAIVDPPREDVEAAVASLRDAGVKVFMITGDHPSTAMSIAKQIGLCSSNASVLELNDSSTLPNLITKVWRDKDCAVVHGAVIDSLKPGHWECLLAKTAVVFARTTPHHKLEIVRRCQGRGEVVGVVGDGVNDAPALKQADVGIAMGNAGGEVARGAADIVLIKDTFSSVVLGIKQGRTLFDNLVKTTAHTLSHLLPEIVPVLLNLGCGYPLGLSSLQILSIDLGTELAPAIAIAYEEAESGLMKQPPRNPKHDRLVSRGLLIYSYLIAGAIESVLSFVAYVLVFWQHGISISDLYGSADNWMAGSPDLCVNIGTSQETCYNDEQQLHIANMARSACFIVVVMGQLWHVWSCKTRKASVFVEGVLDNRSMIHGVCIGLILLLLLVYLPGVQDVMQTAEVSYEPWLISVAVGVALLIYNELNKKWMRQNQHPRWLQPFMMW